MGRRLSKIYTRTGDEGTTGLGDGACIPKDDVRVEAFGDVDELNSALGVLLMHALPDTVRTPLIRIQHNLFEVGGELCISGHRMIKQEDCERLEQLIYHFNADLPPLKEFILPGGGPAAAACHLTRTVCRRAERRVVTLAHDGDINPQTLIYLNRLSDLLFVLARAQGRRGTQFLSKNGSPTPICRATA